MTSRTGRGRAAVRQPASGADDLLMKARAEAIFTSDLRGDSDPGPAQVGEAVRTAIRTYGGTRGCAAEVAAAYGDHPETAVPRMRWALRVVRGVYSRTAGGPADRAAPPPEAYPKAEESLGH